MTRNKKTPEELQAAKLLRKQKEEELQQKYKAERQKAEEDFLRDRPKIALELLQTALELRKLADEAGLPRADDFDFDETNNLDIEQMDIRYHLWGDDGVIHFEKLQQYSMRDFQRFNSEFEQLKDSFDNKLKAKRAADLERERINQLRKSAIEKLTEEEKKVLNIR